MKLTWFGGTTLRIHIGGRILVCDPDGAPAGIDRAELVSGADRTFGLGDELPEAGPARWLPRRAGALMDEEAVAAEVLLHRLGQGAVLVDAVGEPPLLLLSRPIETTGRWSRDAIIVALSPHVAERILEVMAPRMIALAMPEGEVDAAFTALGERLDGTALVALEPGLAVEA
jgi:hypothetical protein